MVLNWYKWKNIQAKRQTGWQDRIITNCYPKKQQTGQWKQKNQNTSNTTKVSQWILLNAIFFKARLDACLATLTSITKNVNIMFRDTAAVWSQTILGTWQPVLRQIAIKRAIIAPLPTAPAAQSVRRTLVHPMVQVRSHCLYYFFHYFCFYLNSFQS